MLPFVNMSEDPKQEFFSDGMTEEIITTLSKSPYLFVIARNSTFTYKGKPVKVKQVSEELGVRYVLEGSVRRSGEKVRITAQFIDAMTGYHLWAERYDRDLKDIFALQDEIAFKIMTTVHEKLEWTATRVSGRGARNLEAFLKTLEGREHIYRATQGRQRPGTEAFRGGHRSGPESRHCVYGSRMDTHGGYVVRHRANPRRSP